MIAAILLPPAVLLAAALLLRFAVRGYEYIAYALAYCAVMLLIKAFAPAVLWKTAVWLTAAGLIYFAAVEVPIIANSFTDKDAKRPYLIVLGGWVNGTNPSRALRLRLERALAYLTEYPDTVCILSGGKGDDEDISEAQCMYAWLTEKGIARERLMPEAASTSTKENMEYSFALIRQRGDDPDGNTAIVSSSYHLYRAKLMARQLGVEAAGVAARPGTPLLALNFYIREAFGLTHFWAFGW